MFWPGPSKAVVCKGKYFQLKKLQNVRDKRLLSFDALHALLSRLNRNKYQNVNYSHRKRQKTRDKKY
jgi:hypothetical protein